MTYTFLSEEWFGQVKRALAERRPELPDKLSDLVVNVVVQDGSDGQPLHAVYRGCWLEPGESSDAQATLFTTRALAYEVLVEKKMAAGVRALSTGAAKLRGDRRKLLALRAVRPTPSQVAFECHIQELTRL